MSKKNEENFQGRKNTLLRKAAELEQIYDAEVFLVIRRQEKFYSHTTSKAPPLQQNSRDPSIIEQSHECHVEIGQRQ
jgi:hypothetical protein